VNSTLMMIATLAAGLVASAFAFAIAHDTRKPAHRRVARWILFATLAAMPVFMAWHLVLMALGDGEIQFGGKYSDTYVTFRESPGRFFLTAFTAMVVSTLPLVAAWPTVGSLFRKEPEPE
jgi:hypothetical protein